MSAIAVAGLHFAYDGTPALGGVSFAAAPGSVTALVGPNGAGKTTLMRCLAGLEVPDAGTISLAGIDVVADPRAARARMGFLQDFFGLYDRLSVRRCLDYAARSRLVPAAERPGRIDAVAASLGLGGLLDRQAAALSRGQRQRVAIGTAIIHRPPVLILDEPAAGLDPEARAELAVLLRQLAADGMTLLVSSHILAELEDYSTDVLMLDAGQVIGHGPLVQPERRLALVLAGGDGAAAASALVVEAGVTAVAAEGLTVSFDFAGNRAAQAALLARLVGAGWAIAAFEERQGSMQDLYLARLRAARGAP
ncbi:ABC transporter ATP-binding protein [Elioraea sp.]|uniref:ABC transporter ATP-binding protein n=1 Tax=Elioraea sp. TaxID=2185103 RepID=UPI0025BFECB9|nr:ABC transporter ATP-binding protein [Elioraea sp.]